MGAFLFDLDNTLVNSAATKSMRTAGLWRSVMANLHLIQPFTIPGKHQPHQFPQIVKSDGYSVGIVTASPRMYAEAVLKMFKIPYDTLVAYHDTKEHKPDAEPLQLALTRLNVDPANAVYFGDDAVDVEAAYRASVKSIGAGWGMANKAELSSTAPDVLVYALDVCLPLGKMSARRYGGEIKNVEKLVWHEGSVLHIEGIVPTFALGRYFTVSDPRHPESSLSKNIIDHKGEEGPSRDIAERLAVAITNTGYAKKFRYIVGVPPKPGKARDRIGEVLTHLPAFVTKPKYLPGVLECVRDYGELKHLGVLDRKDAVQKAFRTSWELKGNNFILVDDVHTTGSTTSECCRVLKAAGAAEVAVVTFGKDQRSFARKMCTECGRQMKIRKRGRDGIRFWGCSGYVLKLCDHTEDL